MLYHITEPKNVDSILKHGINPSIGANSQRMQEDMPLIFLCTKEFIPHWKIMLNRSAVIAVNLNMIREEDILPGMNLQGTAIMNTMLEYIYGMPVEPNRLSLYEIAPYDVTKECDRIAMRDLCRDYMEIMSKACECAARYYSGEADLAGRLDFNLMQIFAVSDRLDYSVVSRDTIRNWLLDYGSSGEYALTDTYDTTDRRLYQQLKNYPKDGFSDKLCRLSDYISTTFAGCLDVNTGGWQLPPATHTGVFDG